MKNETPIPLVFHPTTEGIEKIDKNRIEKIEKRDSGTIILYDSLKSGIGEYFFQTDIEATVKLIYGGKLIL